jgi:hypothetical protein
VLGCLNVKRVHQVWEFRYHIRLELSVESPSQGHR